MILVEPSNRIIKVELMEEEVRLIMQELEQQPHNIYKYFNYEIIIQRLEDALQENGGKK